MVSLTAVIKSKVATTLPWTERVPLRVAKQINEALAIPGASASMVYEVAKERWPELIGGVTQFKVYARKLKEQAHGTEVSGGGGKAKGQVERRKPHSRRGRKDAAKR